MTDAIGDRDNRGAGRVGHIGDTLDLGHEPLNRRGLHDVERLARRDRAGARRLAESIGQRRAGQHMREAATQLSCSEDGDVLHAWAIVMAPMSMSLRGQVAMVTGGSRGIGLAIAHALVANGVNVAITGRNETASVGGATAH